MANGDQAEAEPTDKEREAIICPACGATAVPEKCNRIAAAGSPAVCRSDVFRARVVMNCSEF